MAKRIIRRQGYGSLLRRAGLWSTAATLLFIWSIVKHSIRKQLKLYLDDLARRIRNALSPYDTITIDEYAANSFFTRSGAYVAAEAYLSATAAASRARGHRAALAGKGITRMSLALDDNQEVVDEFRGAKIWWCKTMKEVAGNKSISYASDERRAYRLTFHLRHRGIVHDAYLPHVLAEGRAVLDRNRQRRLFTNSSSGAGRPIWCPVRLEHPSTFATLAMDPDRKQEILDDLTMFREGKEYYASIGKAWKRGYLLFGPPGTGKSTMIAAMANFLDYDVYDLELTAVRSNTDLRSLFLDTTGRSIIVVEDIDCSVDLTGKRKKSSKTTTNKQKTASDDEKVTLSGVLNCIDGLSSACAGERIIVFTTNHREKLDPALIRRGRMDMHIEMFYCCFESFKVLAKNYLGVVDHHLFGEIQQLLGQVDMSPADVAENLMPRSNKRDVDDTLACLVNALKEDALARKKEEEEDDSNDDEKDEKNDLQDDRSTMKEKKDKIDSNEGVKKNKSDSS